MTNEEWGKIAVMGAGAVGCYYGGMLARAGANVTLIGRPTHVDAIARDGLLVETAQFSERVRPDASIDPAAIAGARLVLFCVKSTATEEAARAIAPHLAPDAIILGLQNGVDNFERLRLSIERTIIPAVVYVGCAMAGPGHVRHNGRGDLVIGAMEPPRDPTAMRRTLDSLAALLGTAGVPVRVSDNVAGELWTKLVINCAYNAVSALARARYGAIIAEPQARRLMRDVVEECEAVAIAKGVRIPEANLLETVYAVAAAMPLQTSSTAQDIARGQPTEIDHLNGYVARQGEALSVQTPVNRTLHALVKLVDQGAKAAAPSPPA